MALRDGFEPPIIHLKLDCLDRLAIGALVFPTGF